MSFVDLNLHELADLEGPPRSFLTFYFTGESGARELKNRAAKARGLIEHDEPDRLADFDAALERLEALMEGETFEEGAGYCLMACPELRVERGFKLTVPAETAFRAARGPNLRPLAEMQDEYEPFLLVAANNDGARILQIAGAVADAEEDVKGGVKNRVKKGGWSQQRYARRRKGQLHRYAAEVAERLAELTKEHGPERIVLLGSQETRQQIEEELPDRLKERVIAEEGFDLDAAEEALVEEGLRLFQKEERREEQALWKRIQNETLSGGLGAIGPEDVLTALQTGRVDELAVDHDVAIEGSRCDACTTAFVKVHDRCPLCDSPDVAPIPLVEELVRLAEQTDADVEFTQGVKGLVQNGGVAALLRW
ncbi:Vms1/Ankzf1 family peptidyl-tRNA hydrolase [Alienimonas sp. DA493]|uniref:baeRF10 domain-containing protein n=1 Tax=Alienimonas sp. DA493 TaxID=3373605 RepID=UPI0037540536